MTMVLLSSLLRFWQEHRSAKSAEALKAMVRTTATVLRREQVGSQPILREVPMRDLVAGDIVQLSAGDMIPGRYSPDRIPRPVYKPGRAHR